MYLGMYSALIVEFEYQWIVREDFHIVIAQSEILRIPIAASIRLSVPITSSEIQLTAAYFI